MRQHEVATRSTLRPPSQTFGNFSWLVLLFTDNRPPSRYTEAIAREVARISAKAAMAGYTDLLDVPRSMAYDAMPPCLPAPHEAAGAIGLAPVKQAMWSACKTLAASDSVSLDRVPIVFHGTGHPAAVIDPVRSSIVLADVSVIDRQSLARALGEIPFPIRCLVGPEMVVDWVAKAIAEQWALRVIFDRRQRLWFSQATPFRRPPIRGARRLAQESDLPWINSVTGLDLSGPWNAAQEIFTRECIALGRCHLWEDEEPVSLAMLGGDDCETYEIINVYTAPEHRRCGFASALVTEIAGLRTPAIATIFVEDGNQPAEQLYRSIGFQTLDWWRCILLDGAAHPPS